MALESEVAEVLAAARRGLSPTPADQARIRRLTEATLRAGAGAAAASSAASTSPARGVASASRAWPWLGRLVAVGAVAATAAGVGYRAGWRAGRSDAVAPVAAPAQPTELPVDEGPAAAEPESVAPVPASSPAGRLSSRSGPRRRAPTTQAVPPAASLAEEVRALRSVERALREHNPGFALALLRELDRAVPTGALTEERQAMRAIARCASGDVPFDVSFARDFAERYPGSVYERRVNEACAATDSAASGDQVRRRKSP